MSSLFQPTEVQNHVSRNGFDLSRKVSFTSKAGELLPVWWTSLIPGDKARVDVNHFCRTQPMNSAAFTRINQYYDFYFVPVRLLWRFAPQFFTDMKDNVQVATAPNIKTALKDTIPYLPSSAITSALCTSGLEKAKDYVGMPRQWQMIKLLNYLGYKAFRPSLFADRTGNSHKCPATQPFNLNVFPILAYQKICQDYFRNTQWQDSNPLLYNVDYSTGGELDSAPWMPDETLPDETTPLDMQYCDYKKDYFTGVIPNSQYGAVSTVSTADENEKLFSMIKQPNGINFSGPNAFYSDAAFVSQVRNVKASGQSGNYVQVTAPPSGSESGGATLRPHMDSSTVTRLMSELNTHYNNAVNSFSVLALRKAEALQKLREIQLSNEQDYPSQIRAIWNVNVSNAFSQKCQYLGGVSGNIDINPVVNNNLSDPVTTENPQGSTYIQGTGTSLMKKEISFEAHEHGYLFCIYHALPMVEYDLPNYPFEATRLHLDDFANPLFDKVGYEPQFSSDVSGIFSVGATSMQTLRGYMPRYMKYKTDYDTVLGGFSDVCGGSLQNWCTPLLPDIGYDLTNPAAQIKWTSFKCSPSILDPVFGVKAVPVNGTDGNPGYVCDTDQFLNTAFFDVKMIRNLDRDGMPY